MTITTTAQPPAITLSTAVSTAIITKEKRYFENAILCNLIFGILKNLCELNTFDLFDSLQKALTVVLKDFHLQEDVKERFLCDDELLTR